MNILREGWSAALGIYAVLMGLVYLFTDPNPADPLNKEAAELMQSNPAEFERTVHAIMRGGRFFGIDFPRVI